MFSDLICNAVGKSNEMLFIYYFLPCRCSEFVYLSSREVVIELLFFFRRRHSQGNALGKPLCALSQTKSETVNFSGHGKPMLSMKNKNKIHRIRILIIIVLPAHSSHCLLVAWLAGWLAWLTNHLHSAPFLG